MRHLLIVAALFAFAAVGVTRAAEKDTKSLIGKPAPDFSLQRTDGKDMKLSEEKGNVVLIDFWATWCPPCRASLPHLQKIHEDQKLADKGLHIFAVNEGEEKDKAKSYLDQNNLTFPCVLDKSSAVGNKYLVHGIPTTVIIGRDGKVRNVWIGYGDGMEEQVRKALDGALSAPKTGTAKGPSTKPSEQS